ncbi:unnamed protein product, partial [Prorocentrum cordatum]
VPEVVLDQLTYTLACAAGRPAASRDALSRVLQLVAGRGARLCLRARGALPGLLRDVRAAAACAVEDGRAEEVWLVHAGILHCLALDAGGADGFLVQALPDVLEVAERRPPEGRAPGGAGGAASQSAAAPRELGPLGAAAAPAGATSGGLLKRRRCLVQAVESAPPGAVPAATCLVNQLIRLRTRARQLVAARAHRWRAAAGRQPDSGSLRLEAVLAEPGPWREAAQRRPAGRRAQPRRRAAGWPRRAECGAACDPTAGGGDARVGDGG